MQTLSDEPSHQTAKTEAPTLVTTENIPVAQNAWITKFKVLISTDGESWDTQGPFVGCSDVSSISVVKLAEKCMGRYVKIVPLTWEVLPALRLEVMIFNVGEHDESLNEAQDEILKYLGLLTNLLSAGELLLEEAKIKWKRSKDSQREKQAELANVLNEVRHSCIFIYRFCVLKLLSIYFRLMRSRKPTQG